MMPNLVDNASASSMECVVNSTAQFPARTPEVCTASCTAPHKARLAAGSKPQLGSSSTARLGLPIKAKAALSFRLFPPLSRSARRCAIFSNLKFRKASWIASAGKPLRAPKSDRWSRTVSSSSKASNCGQYPIFWRALPVSRSMCRPPTWISPAVVFVSPTKHFIAEVFPAPLCPNSPKTSPACTANDIPLTACFGFVRSANHPR
mmetsp:Transcript_19297/g.67184  ORF Transcript_19297/g.67184 Transcript_19297/m.67184 type:complete len:205 (+) Transcript_19297:714-1328(+)